MKRLFLRLFAVCLLLIPSFVAAEGPVAHMPDRSFHRITEKGIRCVGHGFRDKPLPFVEDDPALPVKRCDTRGFLSPVLLGEETFRNKGGGGHSAACDPAQPAVLTGCVHRQTSLAAPTSPEKRGWGARGRDLNSGWYWHAMNQG